MTHTDFDPFSLPPPHSLESEKAVLGAMMANPGIVPEVLGALKADDFYSHILGVVFEAIQELAAKLQSVDLVTVSEHLKYKGQLNYIGGRDTLNGIVVDNLDVGVDYHVVNILDLAQRRRYLEKSVKIAEACHTAPKGEISGIVMDEVRSVESTDKGDVLEISSVMPDVFADIEKHHQHQGQVLGTKTGIIRLDHATGGLQASDLIVIAARPSMGKTAMALQIASHVAYSSPVLLFTLEMSKHQLGMRLLSSVSGVESGLMRTGRLNEQQWDAIAGAISRISNMKLLLDDGCSKNMNDLFNTARFTKTQHPEMKLIVVDYLQLMSAPNRNFKDNNRVQEISAISRGLKLLARELDVTVIALSQLSRSVESREDKRPRLSDLRDSGAIEQDADIVMFLYRDDYYNKDSLKAGTAELIVSKHRNGPLLTMEMYFRAGLTKFVEVA